VLSEEPFKNNLLKTTFWKKVGPKLQPMERKSSSEAGSSEAD